jgi:hypothetical protein
MMGTYLMGIVGPRHVDEAEIALLLFAVLCVLLAYIVDQETKEPARRWCDAGRSDRRRGDDLRKKKPPEKHVCFRCGLVKEQSPRNAPRRCSGDTMVRGSARRAWTQFAGNWKKNTDV